MSHLRYLRYVLLHKWYVLRAGLFIGTPNTIGTWRWLWRLIRHDASKFRPSEWRPYAGYFYGGETGADAQRWFDAAWLAHIHRNPHHWQHWVLHEDSGKTKILLIPIADVDEMIADWLGAGTKILRYPSLGECVVETITWYVASGRRMMLRQAVRERVDATLYDLSQRIGLPELLRDELAAARHKTVVAHLDSLGVVT